MSLISDSVFAISGGTGSFGSTMVRHLLENGAKEIRVFSRDEAKQDYLRRQTKDSRLRFFLADTRDLRSLHAPLDGADFLFHAAAIKQVPSAEFFPIEATLTNVIGSNNVLSVAQERGVRKAVCLSTDKAVYPINAMGISKALMEKTALAHVRTNSSGMDINVTRYGNVLMSRGSVVPYFVSQLKIGESLSVTNPAMTRFLMSLEESVELVMHALAPESGSGNIFVKKAPSATLESLAAGVALAMGRANHKIVTIGTRHGEKMHESLLSSEEASVASDQGNYFQVPLDARDLNYDMYFEKGDQGLATLPAYTSGDTLNRMSPSEVAERLLELADFRELVNA